MALKGPTQIMLGGEGPVELGTGWTHTMLGGVGGAYGTENWRIYASCGPMNSCIWCCWQHAGSILYQMRSMVCWSQTEKASCSLH